MRGKELLLGDLRGSLAGMTASRNASGSFLRQRVSPVQPNTLAQTRAKASFGAISPLYRALSAVERGSWNNFSKSFYSAKNKSNTGQFTGQMAFQALQTSFFNSTGVNRTYNLKVNGVIIPGGYAPEPFIGSPNFAPSVASTASLLGIDGQSKGLQLSGATFGADGAIEVIINVGNGSGIALDNYLNSFGKKVGFAVFCSSSNPADQMFYRNKEKYLLGYFKHPEVTVINDLVNVSSFSLDSNDVFNTAVYQGFPPGSSYVMISVYMITKENQMNLIGRVETQVVPLP